MTQQARPEPPTLRFPGKIPTPHPIGVTGHPLNFFGVFATESPIFRVYRGSSTGPIFEHLPLQSAHALTKEDSSTSRISTSAGIPSPMWSLRIIGSVSERLWLSTSATRARLPM